MAQTSINIRIDDKLKKQFEAICSQIGFNMSTAVNVFARAVVRKKGIPFELTIDEYDEETIKAIEDAEKGVGLVGPFNSVSEALKSMLEDEE